MNTELQQSVTFEQAIDEVGALYEDTKEHLRLAMFAVGASPDQIKAIDRAMANNVRMRDYACAALQKAYNIKVGQ